MTDRISRAKARAARMTIQKGRLGETIADPSPVFGAEAVSLVHRLTQASYSLAGQKPSTYARADIPCRFVPWRAQ